MSDKNQAPWETSGKEGQSGCLRRWSIRSKQAFGQSSHWRRVWLATLPVI